MSFPLPSLAALQLVCDAEKLWGMLMSPWEGEHPLWEQSQQSSAGKRVRGAVGGGAASWGWAPVGTFPATQSCCPQESDGR